MSSQVIQAPEKIESSLPDRPSTIATGKKKLGIVGKAKAPRASPTILCDPVARLQARLLWPTVLVHPIDNYKAINKQLVEHIHTSN